MIFLGEGRAELRLTASLKSQHINFFYVHTKWYLKQIHLHLLAIKILKAF